MKPQEVSPQDYHSKLKCNRADIFAEDSWLSKSVLWELKKASLYQWRFAPATFAGSAAATWGSLLDCLITTPDEFDDISVISPYDSFRTKEAKEWKAEQSEAGRLVIDEAMRDNLHKAAERMQKQPHAGEIIENSDKQVMLLSELNGVKFKGLVDLAPRDRPYLADIKTTGAWGASEMAASVGKFGYHVQAAVYLAMWNRLNPDGQRKRFRIVWQQNFAPFECTVTELPATDIAAGEEFASYLINKLVRAAKKNWWPNIHGDQVAMLGAAPWAIAEADEIMTGGMTAPK